MEQEECLVKLEKTVVNLLASYKEVKQENNLLENRLMQSKRDLAALQERLDLLYEEKSTVLKRVDAVIGSIEKWEESFAVDPSKGDVPDSEKVITQEPRQHVLTLDGGTS
ncbi:MAG: hypothetical protein KKB30_07635 [Proteobacteria bacterium]|nr:hypothetical protein [Pseudomonadota bacterium]MBU1715849.1 hypothetical protein [Pseudomonadota bacterium]